MKYSVHRKQHISASTRVSDRAVADGDSLHSTTSKNNKETITKPNAEVLKGLKLPDAIFKAVLLKRAREQATLVPNVDNDACCESTTENNSKGGSISSKDSQLRVMDPEHQLPPPKPQVDQSVAVIMTQGKAVGGASSGPLPVSSITTHGDSDTSQAPSLSHNVVFSNIAQPSHTNSPPACTSNDLTRGQSDTVGDCHTDIRRSHSDQDSSLSPSDSHSSSDNLEHAALTPTEDHTSSSESDFSPNHVPHKDFQFQNNTNPQSTDCGTFIMGAAHSLLSSTSTSMCSGVDLSSQVNHTAVDTSLPTVAALDPLRQDHQPSSALSQGFSDLDVHFSCCTIPCDPAPIHVANASDCEYSPSYLEAELMPGAQSLTFNDPSNPCDPITQQVLGDVDILDGKFDPELNAMAMASGLDWSNNKNLPPQCHTNFFASCSESISNIDELMAGCQDDIEVNHEIHDILQQFM